MRLLRSVCLAILVPLSAAAAPSAPGARFDILPAMKPTFSPSNAPVTRVVLYPDSALVEREARVKAGAESLKISELPANFDIDSLRIEADNGIEIGELVWRDSVRINPLNAEEARLEAEVQKLADLLQTLDVEKKTAERELKFLEALAAPGGAKNKTDAADNPAHTLDVIHQGSLRAERRILEIEVQKRDLEKRYQALQAEYESVRVDVDTVRALTVRLLAKNDGNVRFSYFFAGAGWRPAYRAALDSESGQVKLERMAQIGQQSGEDWSRVRMTLSTGAPRQNAVGQKPYTWSVNLQEVAPKAPSPVMYSEEVAEMSRSVVAEESVKNRRRAAKASDPLFSVQVVENEYATEYAVNGTVSLPADGRKVAVSLGGQTIPVSLEAEISPRLQKAAYLVARGELPGGVWPTGMTQLYRNGAYVGQANWGAEQNRLELSFGRDDLVQVSHKSEEDQQGKSGLVGQSAERRIIDTFTVTNRHKRAIDIRVLEASPVGRNDAIKIERRFTPADVQEDWNDRQGVIAWQDKLDAGQSKKFTADYRIVWPKDRRILGLP